MRTDARWMWRWDSVKGWGRWKKKEDRVQYVLKQVGILDDENEVGLLAVK